MNHYPTIRRLFPRRVSTNSLRVSDLNSSIDKLGQNLRRANALGRLQLEVLGEGKSTHFSLDFLDGETRTGRGAVDNADLEIVVSEDTWAEIANGDLSPADAYVTGRMEISGDIGLAKRLYATAVSGRRSLEDLPG